MFSQRNFDGKERIKLKILQNINAYLISILRALCNYKNYSTFELFHFCAGNALQAQNCILNMSIMYEPLTYVRENPCYLFRSGP